MKTPFMLVMFAWSMTAQVQNNLPLPAAGNVTLTLDEYNKLVELAGQPAKKTDEPPLPFVLNSVQMNLDVKGDSVFGSVVMSGEILAKGERKVPLLSGMTILDAQQKGKDLPIEQIGGTDTALLTGPSDFAVTLNTGSPLNIETGRASFDLPVPSAGAARLTLSVPGDQTLVNLSPGLITGRSSSNGRTIIEATLVPGQTANLWWAVRLNTPVAPAVPKEVRFLSDVKSLISVGESDLTLVVLAEVTLVQGEPAQFVVQTPEGYEVTGVTGPTMSTSDVKPHSVVLNVENPALRSHQFLLSLVKANTAAKADIPMVSFQGTQRETGEVLVEGEGAIDLTATERGGLRRMDLKETSPYLRSLARTALQAAFRYQRKPSETPGLALAWVRFPNSSQLSAVAQTAVVTTLITSEGRSLTEVKLTLKNQAQPFLKVALPAGASILSSEVAGEKVKPVEAPDGNRVPLLRPGFRPSGSYTVSFVFLHAGAPFAKKGGAELSLPKMDIPVGLLEWEVFLPQQYKVADFGGDAISQRVFPPPGEDAAEELDEVSAPFPIFGTLQQDSLSVGQVGGYITDPAGAVIPGVSVTVVNLDNQVTLRTITDQRGHWIVSNVPSGRIEITAFSSGFKKYVRELSHDARRFTSSSFTLEVGAQTEQIAVEASASEIRKESEQVERAARQSAAAADVAASANVTDLQRRVVGVLPIAVNVPRTGSSYRFVRPLVVDEETKLTFSYRSK